MLNETLMAILKSTIVSVTKRTPFGIKILEKEVIIELSSPTDVVMPRGEEIYVSTGMRIIDSKAISLITEFHNMKAEYGYEPPERKEIKETYRKSKTNPPSFRAILSELKAEVVFSDELPPIALHEGLHWAESGEIFIPLQIKNIGIVIKKGLPFCTIKINIA